MTTSRLLLEHYFIEELSVVADIGAAAAAQAGWHPEPVTTRDYASSPEDPRLHQVRLTIEFGQEDGTPTPYRVRLALRGVFRVHDSVDDKRLRDGLVTNTAPSILYGAAREIVLATTARGPYPAVLLPAEVFPPEVLSDALEANAEPVPEAPARKPRKRRTKTAD